MAKRDDDELDFLKIDSVETFRDFLVSLKQTISKEHKILETILTKNYRHAMADRNLHEIISLIASELKRCQFDVEKLQHLIDGKDHDSIFVKMDRVDSRVTHNRELLETRFKELDKDIISVSTDLEKKDKDIRAELKNSIAIIAGETTSIRELIEKKEQLTAANVLQLFNECTNKIETFITSFEKKKESKLNIILFAIAQSVTILGLIIVILIGLFQGIPAWLQLNK